MAVVSTRRGFKPVFTFRSEITDSAVRKEFEQLYAALDALFDTFFNSDGTHKPITTTQVTIQQNTELNETTTPLTIINNNGQTVTAAGSDTEVQFNGDGSFAARPGLRFLYRNDAAIELGTPAAPSVANTGAGAYAATLRYYRIQWADSNATESELGPATSFTPSGSGTHARVTRPGVTSANITNWAVFGSADGVSYKNISGSIAIGTTTYDDNVAPAAYTGSAPYSDGQYEAMAQLRLTVADSAPHQALLMRTDGGASAGWMPYNDEYQEWLVGMEIRGGLWIATSDIAYIIYWYTPHRTCGFTIYPGQTPGSAVTFANPMTFNFGGTIADNGSVGLALQDASGNRLGSDKPGFCLNVGRNEDGSGAAGTVGLRGADNTQYFLWVDATGDLRIGTAAPTANGSVSDTSGTVVGTQS